MEAAVLSNGASKAVKIEINTEELKTQSACMGALAQEYAQIQTVTLGLLSSVNSYWSEDLARHFEGKIDFSKLAFNKLVNMLTLGSNMAMVSATTFSAVDDVLAYVMAGAHGADSLNNACNIILERINSLYEKDKPPLNSLVGSTSEFFDRVEGLSYSVIGKGLDILIHNAGGIDKEDGVPSLLYGLWVDIADGEVDMNSVFSVADWSASFVDKAAGGEPFLRGISEATEAAYEHYSDYIIFHAANNVKIEEGDYVDYLIGSLGGITSQASITAVDALGSVVFGMVDNVDIIPGLINFGDVSDFLFGENMSGLWDNGIVQVREFTQDVIDYTGERLQDCFDYTVDVVQDTFDNIEDGLNDVCNAIGNLFSW